MLPKFHFVPIFYVLDVGRGRVLVVKRQDRYEIKGMYLEWDMVDGWEVYYASLNVQSFNEYPDRFDLTKNEEIARAFAESMATVPKLTEEQCNHKYATHYYKY